MQTRARCVLGRLVASWEKPRSDRLMTNRMKAIATKARIRIT